MELKKVKKRYLFHKGLRYCKYSGWGYNNCLRFIPHGSGKMSFRKYDVRGNFVRGELSGPASLIYDNHNLTSFFQDNIQRGWGLIINWLGHNTPTFGFFVNGHIVVDLSYFIQWYCSARDVLNFDEKITTRNDKNNKQVTEILIWRYSDKDDSKYEGFRFSSDGSVWVGTSELKKVTGILVHFMPNGTIDAGNYIDGVLHKKMTIQDIIDYYYRSDRINETFLQQLPPESRRWIRARQEERETFRNIPDIVEGRCYFSDTKNC